MKLFDRFLQGLGFEGSETDKQPREKKVKEKKEKRQKPSFDTNAGVKFNLDRKEEVIEEPEVFEEETLQAPTTPSQTTASAGFDIETPKSQAEVQAIIENVRLGKTVIVNVSGFNATDRVRSLDFMAGAIYVLKGRIQSLEGNLFILYPSNK